MLLDGVITSVTMVLLQDHEGHKNNSVVTYREGSVVFHQPYSSAPW